MDSIKNLLIILILIIIIYLILNNYKEHFNLYNVKNIKEAKLKLDIFGSDIIKGSQGQPGTKGDKGNNGFMGPSGLKGDKGNNGLDGLDSGSISFINKDGDLLDKYVANGNNYTETLITVPNGLTGFNGSVGPIFFVTKITADTPLTLNDNKIKQNAISKIPSLNNLLNGYIIIGEYIPEDKDALQIEPIIIDVPKGLAGSRGLSGKCLPSPDGLVGKNGEVGIRGERGERGEPGKKGENGITPEEPLERAFNTLKINKQICFGYPEQNYCLDSNDLSIIVDEFHKHNLDPDYVSIIEKRYKRLLAEKCNLKKKNDDSLNKVKLDYINNELLEILKLENKNAEIKELTAKDCNYCNEGYELKDGSWNCTKCEPSFYKNKKGNELCTKCGVCDAGENRSNCGDTSGGECIKNTCSCANGTIATGAACTTDGANICTSCNTGFYKSGNNCVRCKSCGVGEHETRSCNTNHDRQCTRNQCNCTDGIGASGANCPRHGDWKCAICKSNYYSLRNNLCTYNQIHLYQKTSYNGQNRSIGGATGTYTNLNDLRYNFSSGKKIEDTMTSFKKDPNAKVTLYQHKNGEGKCVDLTGTGNIYNVGSWWNDRVSSIGWGGTPCNNYRALGT